MSEREWLTACSIIPSSSVYLEVSLILIGCQLSYICFLTAIGALTQYVWDRGKWNGDSLPYITLHLFNYSSWSPLGTPEM